LLFTGTRKVRKPLAFIAIIVVFSVAGVFVFNRTTRVGYESAQYTVVATTTRIDAQGRDGSFMKLFRYISGANESDQKISMTTPVLMRHRRSEAWRAA